MRIGGVDRFPRFGSRTPTRCASANSCSPRSSVGLEQTVASASSAAGDALTVAAPASTSSRRTRRSTPELGCPLVNMAGEVVGVNSMPRATARSFRDPLQHGQGAGPAARVEGPRGLVAGSRQHRRDHRRGLGRLKLASREACSCLGPARKSGGEGGIKANDVITRDRRYRRSRRRAISHRIVSSSPVGKRIRVLVMPTASRTRIEVEIGRYQGRPKRSSGYPRARAPPRRRA